MLRRTLLLSTPLAVLSARARAAAKQAPHIIELRSYSFASPEKQAAFSAFLAATAVPAWNRAGVRPVGLFEMRGADNPDLGAREGEPPLTYVLLPHASWQAFAAAEARLAGDRRFQREGSQILRASKAEPAFSRWDSQLFIAFAGWPRVRSPRSSDPANRLFELRSYESHNEERAENKIAMFENGEFPIFDRAGMQAVFYGRALAGVALPQLSYMVMHAHHDRVKANWKSFFQDPDWKRLSGDAKYQDNVSKVVARFLRPLPGSQI